MMRVIDLFSGIGDFSLGLGQNLTFPDDTWRFEQTKANFMRRVIIDPETECWNWQGHVGQNGYGQCWDGKKVKGAHVVAYVLFVGHVPVGLDLDHLCRNRRCVNPAHLEPVTRRENLMRGDTIPAHKAAQTTCKHGHLLEGENLYLYPDGRRGCRICRADEYRKWVEENRERRQELDRNFYRRKKEANNV